MNSRIAKTAYCLTITFVLAAAAATLLSATWRADATTQGEEKKLEGTWRVDVTPRNCISGDEIPGAAFKALITFAKGGTVNATTTNALSLPPTGAKLSNDYGVWQRASDHSFTTVSEFFVFNSSGVWLGIHRLNRTIQIDDDPNTFSQTATGVFLAPDGVSPLPGFPLMVCSTGVGHRLE
jgi:hypothetical protein